MKVNAVHPQKGDTMNTIRAGTGYPPSIVKIKFIDIHTAVFDGIAVFFHSTHFFFFLYIPENPIIFLMKAHLPYGGCAFSLS